MTYRAFMTPRFGAVKIGMPQQTHVKLCELSKACLIIGPGT